MMQKVARTLVVVALFLTVFRITASGAEEKTDGPANGSHYKLGAQDKVAIKVYEWRPSRDEIYEWTAFKAEYVVSGSGFLSLPLLGDVQANGLTTAELSQDLGARLKERMGLMASPDVTVEVVLFRPFYIVGAIEKPGEYPYRPGLNVLEAYAIAGGRPRGSPARLEREAIATRGDLNAYSLETLTLRARMARLQAEISDTTEVKWPSKPEGQVSPALDRAISQERLVFDMRRESVPHAVHSPRATGGLPRPRGRVAAEAAGGPQDRGRFREDGARHGRDAVQKGTDSGAAEIGARAQYGSGRR